jgi:putative endonuclease
VARDYNFGVYIVKNDQDTVLYIEMTNDLVRRISEHRAGEIPGFSADYRCRKLIYYEHTTDARVAISREKLLKKWSRTKKLKLINAMNPRWVDLGRDVLYEQSEMSPAGAGKLFRST